MSDLTKKANKIENLINEHGEIKSCKRINCAICNEIKLIRNDLNKVETTKRPRSKKNKPRFIYTIQNGRKKKTFYRIDDISEFLHITPSCVSKAVRKETKICGYSITKKKIEKEGKQMILLTKKKRNELANELAISVTNYDKVIQEFKEQIDIMTRERDAAKTNARDTTSKYKLLEKDLERLESELSASETERMRIKSSYARLKVESYRKEQIITLKKEQVKNKSLEAQIIELRKELSETKDSLAKEEDARKTYEFISNNKNKQISKECFSHNLSYYFESQKFTEQGLADRLGVKRERVSALKSGSNGPTVASLQIFGKLLCKFYGCTLFSLVSEKIEVSK